ncbi:MAG TPA: HAD family hydrolase [Candidatus Dormibacteraeota bacterium]
MLRTVVVDLDDTLLASAQARARGRRTLSRYGVAARDFARADRRWWKRFSTGGVGIEDLRLGRLTDSGLADPALAREADLAYREVAGAINLRRGARRLLVDLREAGLSTVILTNGTVDPQRIKAEQTGLLHLVAGVIVTEEIGFHKPDTRAFAAALSVTGAVPAQAAMVGDRWEFDISGALAAGFGRAVWVSRTRRQVADPRVKIAKSLPQVLPALLN